jgi:phospho-N-acetylmuramoyl-pentapeptide-transferase
VKLILIAGALALVFSLFGTPALIKVLARRGYGQIIRDDGPVTHHTKRGTPTMGGIIIIFSALFAYLFAHLIFGSSLSMSAIIILGLVIALGLVGFIDDYLKVSKQNSAGLSGKQKIFGQVLFASIFGYMGTHFPDKDGLTPISLQLSTVRDTGITLGVVAVVIWVAFMVTATSNGVNLTDGLDGLATGASVMTFLAFVLTELCSNCNRELLQRARSS